MTSGGLAGRGTNDIHSPVRANRALTVSVNSRQRGNGLTTTKKGFFQMKNPLVQKWGTCSSGSTGNNNVPQQSINKNKLETKNLAIQRTSLVRKLK